MVVLNRRRSARRFPATGGKLAVISLSDQVTATERAIRPQAVALAIFAVLAGLVGLAVIGQLLARQMVLDSAEFPILRTLGMTRASLAALALARLAVVTFAGAVLAVGVAVAASPLMPIGPARLAEPAPGTEVNLAVLGAGLAAVAVLPLAVLVPAAWRAAGRDGGPLAVAEPGRAGPAVAVGLGSGPGRVGAGQRGGADGVRAGPGWNAAQGPAPYCAPSYSARKTAAGLSRRHTARHGTRERSPRPCTGIIQNRLIGTPLLA